MQIKISFKEGFHKTFKSLSNKQRDKLTEEWRVLFKFISPTEIWLLEIGHRKDIYQ